INPSRISVTRLMEINVINSVLSCTTRAYTMKGNAKILYADNALGTLYIFSLAFMLFFTAKFLMCMCKMACGKCCRNGQFTRQHHSSTYLGKLASFALSITPHQFQTFPLRGQMRSSAYRTDHQIGQRDTRIQRTIIAYLHPCDTRSCFVHASHILPRCQKLWWQPFGIMSVCSYCSTLYNAHGRRTPVFAHLLRRGLQYLLYDLLGQYDFCRHFFSPHIGKGKCCSLFIARIVALYKPKSWLRRTSGHD